MPATPRTESEASTICEVFMFACESPLCVAVEVRVREERVRRDEGIDQRMLRCGWCARTQRRMTSRSQRCVIEFDSCCTHHTHDSRPRLVTAKSAKSNRFVKFISSECLRHRHSAHEKIELELATRCACSLPSVSVTFLPLVFFFFFGFNPNS